MSAKAMPDPRFKTRWGETPWLIDYHSTPGPMPTEVDFAVVGGGFSGLSTAIWLRKLDPTKSVVLFESSLVGAGSSGHTGGMVLSETAAGDLPGLGDVLEGFTGIVKELALDCDLTLPGVWEIGRGKSLPDSPISWEDSGNVRAMKLVPGGSLNPGKMVSSLARSAEAQGVQIFENAAIEKIGFRKPFQLRVCGQTVRAQKALLATNAMSLELNGLSSSAQPKFTLALATEPITNAQREAIGLGSGKPFYTVDFPYLWGRLMHNGGILFGSGLVHLKDWRELAEVDIAAGQAAELIARLERRVRGLHPALGKIEFTHRWGGPILIPEDWTPVFAQHPKSPRVLVLGGYSGHGVALSVYLGRRAAEAMLGRRALPQWDDVEGN